MSLSDVFFVGKTVYVTTVHEKSPDQVGTPATVTATVTVEDPSGATSSPTPTVTMNLGVATVTWSKNVGTTTALAAGKWEFRVVTSGDLVDAYEGSFYVRESQVV